MRTLLSGGTLATPDGPKRGSLLIDSGLISRMIIPEEEALPEADEIVNIQGLTVFPGGIDLHVHFREPGMTAKGDLASESRAALAGGVTSFFDMPNTLPPTVSMEAVREKMALAKGRCAANYGFHYGATASNFDEASAPDGPRRIKIFMGSSTGGMLLEDGGILRKFFALPDRLILVHSEDETTIREALREARERYGDDIPVSLHPEIRSRRACILSTIRALEAAVKLGTRLHLLHVSTAEEAEMVRAAKIHNPKITAETSINYLWFSDKDYSRLGSLIKCNPAIKTERDRDALREAFAAGVIDTIGSDHAPHLLSEKQRPYLSCPSGIPSVGQTYPVLLTLARRLGVPLSRVAQAFCEIPARLAGLQSRGILREGAVADLAIIDLDSDYVLGREDIYHKCGWSPYEGERLSAKVRKVYLGGRLAFDEGSFPGQATSGREL